MRSAACCGRLSEPYLTSLCMALLTRPQVWTSNTTLWRFGKSDNPALPNIKKHACQCGHTKNHC